MDLGNILRTNTEMKYQIPHLLFPSATDIIFIRRIHTFTFDDANRPKPICCCLSFYIWLNGDFVVSFS